MFIIKDYPQAFFMDPIYLTVYSPTVKHPKQSTVKKL